MKITILIIIVALLVAFRRFVVPMITKRASQSTKTSRPLRYRSLYTVLMFSRLNTRRFFRDRLAIFFTILFPLIFLFVFGSLFSKNSNVNFKIAVINDSKSSFASQFVNQLKKENAFKINSSIVTLNQAEDVMNRNQLDAAIVLPSNFGVVNPQSKLPSGQVQVYYTENNIEAGQTLTSLLDGEFRQINTNLTHAPIPFTVVGKQTNTRSLSQFDYTFSGLLGFAIIGMGIFGPVNVFPELKKQGILRRLHTTPLRVWQYFVSTVISQIILGFISIIIMFIVAKLVFHLEVVGNIVELAAYIALGITMILGIGLALGGWAKNERQVAPLANIIVFPMMFLSGTFFPTYLMPQWLQNISNFLPLTPVINGIRLVATEGKSLVGIAPEIGMVLVWLIIIYAVAFRVFRWE